MADYRLDPCVEGELWSIWQFIAQDNPDAATRVVEAAFDTFQKLAANPTLGKARRFKTPRLKHVRFWRVTGFENYLIFYLPIPKGVQVLHVYHGARDIESLIEEI
ncbi:MAG TPA: type II toxin-antitoxin system RelE/ParE family toxin [Candidatus Limnocylindria bacterium]|jgi:toxin ParE1/3/4|nr:type II toxin-antitoxin system RelE/ParE family toxin [Candidatus Limnocylindria bacterium]